MNSMKHGLSIGIQRIDGDFFLSLKAVGKLTHADYEIITPIIDCALSQVKEPKVDILIDGTELEGWELRAAWDDFKLGLKHNNEFNKVAIYGNKNWQEMAAKLGSWFMSGEVRYFEDLTDAIAWLKNNITTNLSGMPHIYAIYEINTMSTELHHNDAYPPKEIARKVEHIGEAKAKTDTLTLLVLAILAGAFISMGALFYTVVITGNDSFGYGLTRLLGGLSFSLGLVLVIVAGAELFTGNNLIAMAWASGRIGIKEVMRNWILVYIGNVIGCLGTVLLVIMSNVSNLADGAVAETAIDIARSKLNLTMMEALTRGVLCNVFVCLAVWLAIGARSVADKILAIIFPITAFVAIGLEHSIANWFFIPYGLALDETGVLSFVGLFNSIIVVSFGNIIGGTLLVAGVYWTAYLREENKK